MAKVNTTVRNPIYTHEGALAKKISPELELRRSVMACLLWEDEFYESGVTIADRIASLVPKVTPILVANMAIEAREAMKLRHVPLLLVREMARSSNVKYHPFVADTLDAVIQRADELAEFLAIYWKDGKQSLSGQVKKGLATAFTKFDAYQLAKYNRDAEIKLRDVLFLCHAKPKDAEQEKVWKKLVDGTLESPDTWEVNLSAGKDKKATFERLLTDKKLGALALLRNLRNMYDSGVDEKLVISSLDQMKTERVLPYRFIAAAKYAPQWESTIEAAMMKCLAEQDKLEGKTAIVIDVSGSMEGQLSSKSDLGRIDAACGLAILAREICGNADVWTFSNEARKVASRHGFALRDAIHTSQPHGGTYLGKAIDTVNATNCDRVIVITDEQSHDAVGAPKGKGYMINVASNQNGVGYGSWTHIDGWSEAVLRYIQEVEKVG